MRKKVGVWFIAALLLVAGCANNESASSGGSEGGENTPFSFSLLLNLHTPETPNERLEIMMEEATNTELTVQWTPSNTYGEKLNTAFVTGSAPEAILVNTAELILFKESVRDGQFWELGPYLDDYENLSKLYDETLDNAKIDGKLYSLYMGRPRSRTGLIYRKDWADNLGLDAPTTTDELYNMLRAFTEDDPDGNGKDDTIGLTDRAGIGTFQAMGTWFGGPNMWGEKDGKILPEFMFPEYKQTLNYFKDIYENGYINQDAQVTSKTDQQAMLKNGTAGVYIGTMGDVLSLYDDAKAINPDVEFDVHNYVEGPDGTFGVRSNPGYGSLIMFPKSAVETEEELKKILEFYDYLMTPEGANLIIWGVEGEHYEVVDGKAKQIEENRTLIDNQVTPYSAFEIGEPATSGRYEGAFDYEPRAKAEELYKDNAQYAVMDASLGLDSETYITKSESLMQIIEDATFKYALGQIDEEEFDEAIEEWKAAGGQQVIDDFNNQ
ncbi:extracellular solute-binding protein [Aureibacillus halotolerans]|uniref:Putative aldouronate transport system substrate-binding protein n=1 Tax=Aureibacillus halotolerans TaxID=1508390 RepID=A0A4R6TY15_9BACI|nr:extracellular solute-binding protein [Aureibacillus halotolerans]TDQ36785.1 putative aldouronate transport system substrate-binding protein [Aureibacillus halotolerans]